MENLRICVRGENARNQKSKKGRFKGVHKTRKTPKTGKVWVAQITKDYKMMNLGTFQTEEEAAIAYNKASKKLHGDYGHINIL